MWFIETSATAGLQAPLKSLDSRALVSAAFSLGTALNDSSRDGYAWVCFSRWTPTEEGGMERDLDNEYQLAFTRFGVAILLNWDTIFIPSSRSQENRPVLIYDYDAFCYLFCDSSHFLRKQEAWTVFADQFGTEAPPLAEPAPPGKFTPIGDFIALFDRGLDDEGMPIRPRFHNRPASTET